MFTGIISVLGKVETRAGVRLSIRAKINKPKLGASVAVNGVCLTVVSTKNDIHRFEVGPETWSRTNLGSLRTGSGVNIETSLRLGDEIGGHFVSGHVDAAAEVLALKPWTGDFWRLSVALPDALRGLVAPQGSIAVDGISLTVAAASKRRFEIMLVPHTLSRTTLGGRKPGERVNLEADPLARYALNAVKTLRSPR